MQPVDLTPPGLVGYGPLVEGLCERIGNGRWEFVDAGLKAGAIALVRVSYYQGQQVVANPLTRQGTE
jgi:hypothetical protein